MKRRSGVKKKKPPPLASENLASARSDHTDEEDVLIRKLLVDVLKQGNTFALQFIRGHVGHQGNEW